MAENPNIIWYNVIFNRWKHVHISIHSIQNLICYKIFYDLTKFALIRINWYSWKNVFVYTSVVRIWLADHDFFSFLSERIIDMLASGKIKTRELNVIV